MVNKQTVDRQKHGTGLLLGRLAVLIALLVTLMAGLGLLVTRVLQNSYPLTAEDGVDRALATRRTPSVTSVSGFLSYVGSTFVIIGVMLVVAVVFRLTYHRWRESAFLVVAVSSQALVFVLTTLVIHRDRPTVAKLEASPPTSSFPSGHTGAATALYVGIAVVLAWHTRATWARAAVVGLLALVPVSVGLARLYRGMHHPSDVVGGVVNGGLCVLISARSLLVGVHSTGLAARLDSGSHRTDTEPTRP
ncbi:MAG: hypothetical protein NVSMB13_01620 [Mycobacteriales bacterium]